MTSFRRLLTPLCAVLIAFSSMFAGTVAAQDAAQAELGWQATITGQIEAFREKDAPTAFSFAGASFQNTFPDPQTFFIAIINSGYAPIMESSSHSFGKFERLGENLVMQVVNFVGTDQQLYSALYQVQEEPEGWRVQGVALTKKPGVAI